MTTGQVLQTIGTHMDSRVLALAMFALLVVFVCASLVLRKYVRIMLGVLLDQSSSWGRGGSAPFSVEPEEAGGWFSAHRMSFFATDGHRLEGQMLAASKRDSTKGVVVFAHEVGSDWSSCRRYCRPLLDAGYDVFAFDFRGHGASVGEEAYEPRELVTDRERADMNGAVSFVGTYLQKRGRSRDVGVFGISRGGCAAILAAADSPAVRAVITDGVFSSDMTIEFFIRRFATIFAGIRFVAERHPPFVWRFLRWSFFRECRRKLGLRLPSVRKAIGRLGRRPIFFIHGQNDSYIPVSQCQVLYDLARGPKGLWVVPNAKHNQSVLIDSQGYAQRIVQFFDEHLASPTMVSARMDVEEVVAASASYGRAHGFAPIGQAVERVIAD